MFLRVSLRGGKNMVRLSWSSAKQHAVCVPDCLFWVLPWSSLCDLNRCRCVNGSTGPIEALQVWAIFRYSLLIPCCLFSCYLKKKRQVYSNISHHIIINQHKPTISNNIQTMHVRCLARLLDRILRMWRRRTNRPSSFWMVALGAQMIYRDFSWQYLDPPNTPWKSMKDMNKW